MFYIFVRTIFISKFFKFNSWVFEQHPNFDYFSKKDSALSKVWFLLLMINAFLPHNILWYRAQYLGKNKNLMKMDWTLLMLTNVDMHWTLLMLTNVDMHWTLLMLTLLCWFVCIFHHQPHHISNILERHI